MATLNGDAIAALVELGVKLVEAHVGRSIEAVSDVELLQALDAIKVRSADELIAEGQAQVGSTGQEPPG